MTFLYHPNCWPDEFDDDHLNQAVEMATMKNIKIPDLDQYDKVATGSHVLYRINHQYVYREKIPEPEVIDDNFYTADELSKLNINHLLYHIEDSAEQVKYNMDVILESNSYVKSYDDMVRRITNLIHESTRLYHEAYFFIDRIIKIMSCTKKKKTIKRMNIEFIFNMYALMKIQLEILDKLE